MNMMTMSHSNLFIKKMTFVWHPFGVNVQIGTPNYSLRAGGYWSGNVREEWRQCARTMIFARFLSSRSLSVGISNCLWKFDMFLRENHEF